MEGDRGGWERGGGVSRELFPENPSPTVPPRTGGRSWAASPPGLVGPPACLALTGTWSCPLTGPAVRRRPGLWAGWWWTFRTAGGRWC